MSISAPEFAVLHLIKLPLDLFGRYIVFLHSPLLEFWSESEGGGAGVGAFHVASNCALALFTADFAP